jgi:hypothetical protein
MFTEPLPRSGTGISAHLAAVAYQRLNTLQYSSWEMEAPVSSEMLVLIYQTIRCDISEDCNVDAEHFANLRYFAYLQFVSRAHSPASVVTFSHSMSFIIIVPGALSPE